MPVYEYVCEKCEATTEALRPMRDADRPLACEQCGSERTHRAQSVFATATADGRGDVGLPAAGCGRCGDPRGSCGMN